jgi:hypothetical protein
MVEWVGGVVAAVPSVAAGSTSVASPLALGPAVSFSEVSGCGLTSDFLLDFGRGFGGVLVEPETVSSAAFASAAPGVGPFVDCESLDPEEPVEAADAAGPDDGPDAVPSARAIPGLLAIAMPRPSATPNAPTRPMNLAHPLFGDRWLDVSTRGIDIEARFL